MRITEVPEKEEGKCNEETRVKELINKSFPELRSTGTEIQDLGFGPEGFQ